MSDKGRDYNSQTVKKGVLAKPIKSTSSKEARQWKISRPVSQY